MATQTLDPQGLIFSGTASKLGRNVAVSPKNSVLAHLCYGRIRLNAEVPRASFETAERETALLCMRGACRVTVDRTSFDLALHDAIYVPRGSAVEVSTSSEVDLVELSADVTGDYPLQVVRYADVINDPALKFRAGGAATSRDLNIIIGDNVRAGRPLGGQGRRVGARVRRRARRARHVDARRHHDGLAFGSAQGHERPQRAHRSLMPRRRVLPSHRDATRSVPVPVPVPVQYQSSASARLSLRPEPARISARASD